jgi:signal-transduction protein with cAMP-binding, CBS, and nucleotidyltransferase domain
MMAIDVGRIVLTENEIPVGIFTERHVLRRVANSKLNIKTTCVDDVMSSPIHAVAEETKIVDALSEMYRGKIRHLLVRGRHGKISGIVSMRRILSLASELGHGLTDSTPIASVMSKQSLVVDESASVAQTVDRMADTESGAAIVLAGTNPFGIFTERDVLRRVIGVGLDPEQTLIKEVMTTPLFIMPSDSMVGLVLAEMSRRDVRNMPIVNPDGSFAGLVAMPQVLCYAKAFDIDDSVRKAWWELQQNYDSRDDHTPG